MAEAPPTVAIKEANVHLQALHERNLKLEKEVTELKRQEEKQVGQNQILREKDERISYLEGENDQLQQENKVINERLQLQVQENKERLLFQDQENNKKDLLINQLGAKVKLLNEILKYKSALESITLCLEQVEEDFIVDVDNMVQVTENGTDVTEILDVKKLSDIDHETSL